MRRVNRTKAAGAAEFLPAQCLGAVEVRELFPDWMSGASELDEQSLHSYDRQRCHQPHLRCRKPIFVLSTPLAAQRTKRL